jgi:hypothetical protein
MPAQPAQPPGMPGGAALDVTVLEWPVPALPGSGPASHPTESRQVGMWVYDGHVLAGPSTAAASGYREVFFDGLILAMISSPFLVQANGSHRPL